MKGNHQIVTLVLTVKDVAIYLRCHPSTIYRLLKLGKLPAFKVGADWRFNLEEIDKWRLAQSSVTGLSNSEPASPIVASPFKQRTS